MQIAIISDIHANLEAFTAILEEIERREISTVYCLGDIVGYNADPNECAEMVRERKIPTLIGNHDAVACGLEEPLGFNPVAFSAALWTRENLSEDNRIYIENLPDRRILSSEVVGVHGAPSDRDKYLFDKDQTEEEFELIEREGFDLCFFGHTHFPRIFCSNSSELPEVPEAGQKYNIPRDKRFFINPGSVGQPRDNDVRAAMVVFDTEENSVEYVRIKYDVVKAANKIVERGLPNYLADRLLVGR